MGARRFSRRFGMLASDLTQCGYLHVKNSPHHIPVISDLENIDIADEISCVDGFMVGSSRLGGYIGGPEALRTF